MAHCTKCGAVVADNAAFCAACGAPQAVAATIDSTVPGPATVHASTQTGMSENVAATLAYALGWLTGLIFFLIDKRPYVRFHATQSIVVFGGLHILTFIVGALLVLAGSPADGPAFRWVLRSTAFWTSSRWSCGSCS